jgi:hypothetical protein
MTANTAEYHRVKRKRMDMKNDAGDVWRGFGDTRRPNHAAGWLKEDETGMRVSLPNKTSCRGSARQDVELANDTAPHDHSSRNAYP